MCKIRHDLSLVLNLKWFVICISGTSPMSKLWLPLISIQDVVFTCVCVLIWWLYEFSQYILCIYMWLRNIICCFIWVYLCDSLLSVIWTWSFKSTLVLNKDRFFISVSWVLNHGSQPAYQFASRATTNKTSITPSCSGNRRPQSIEHFIQSMYN